MYKVSFHLQLMNFGDADMLNIWREDGTFIEPRAARRRPIGELLARITKEFGTKYFVPFSSMHTYQRADSAWARKYGADLPDYAVGFDSKTSELFPAFIRYDVAKEAFETIDPPKGTLLQSIQRSLVMIGRSLSKTRIRRQ